MRGCRSLARSEIMCYPPSFFSPYHRMMDAYSFQPWRPRGIRKLLASGGSNYIAFVDDKTVLKFPLVSPDEDTASYSARGQKYRREIREASLRGLEVEKKILETIGSHERVIRFKGSHEHGLLLEYMPNGSVDKYLRLDPETSLNQRLKWSLQAAEGVAFIHSKNVIHCDITLGNLLLDPNLDIKLSDFEGKLLSPDGKVVLDGGAQVNILSSMPRDDPDYCDQKTDIFALGTAIYSMITGHRLFPDLDPIDEEEEVRRRFNSAEFPVLEAGQGGDVIRKCWTGGYMLAAEVVSDLQSLLSRQEILYDILS